MHLTLAVTIANVTAIIAIQYNNAAAAESKRWHGKRTAELYCNSVPAGTTAHEALFDYTYFEKTYKQIYISMLVRPLDRVWKDLTCNAQKPFDLVC